MKLLKVSVPNFRNLQNVELTFEPDLNPAVFPVASQNGGGKSTLLQLIFTLLYCTADYQKHHWVINLMNTCKNIEKNEINPIANFDVLYKGKVVSIGFKRFNINSKQKSPLNQDILDSLYAENQYRKIIDNRKSLFKKTADREEEQRNRRLVREIEEKQIATDNIVKLKKEYNKDNNILCSLLVDFNNHGKVSEDSQILYCSIENSIEYDFAMEAFTSMRESIFLAAPSTQPFLFLNQVSRKELFKDLSRYCEILVSTSKELFNFYLYSQLTVSELIETFKKARDKDWTEAINSHNLSYGSKFKQLVDDFHDFLGHDKYILPTPELDSVVVHKQISETERIELEPEDLSHGELRRLGLYAWIKYNIPENSIILIDEVENALHPDWQYNIADELASWGDNQYLLATHSFHLCEALTPKHVKEIEPKMCNPASEVVDND